MAQNPKPAPRLSLGWLCALLLLFLAILLAVLARLDPLIAAGFVLAALSRLIP